MCLKLSCPVDCTTWLTHTGLISIQPACRKIHYRTAITYSPAQHKHWGSHAGKQRLQSQWAHLMVAVSLIIKTHSCSLKQKVCCLWSRKRLLPWFPFALVTAPINHLSFDQQMVEYKLIPVVWHACLIPECLISGFDRCASAQYS